MVALSNTPPFTQADRAEMQDDLDRLRVDHERLSFNVARLQREGADQDYIDRVRDARDVCVRWINRITSRLEASA